MSPVQHVKPGIHLPDSGHLCCCRGFAFVDFATKQEAQAALEAVMGTHLYGRRLVVEWAENEEGLDELRDKTASKFEKDAAPAKQGGKRKKGAATG